MSSSKKKPQTKKSWISLKLIVIPILLLAAILCGILYLNLHPKSNPPMLSTIQKKVASTYSNIAIDTSVWPAQMGSGIGVKSPSYNFQISSQSLPSIYFTMHDGLFSGSSDLKTASSPKTIAPIIDSVITHSGYTTHADSQNTTTYTDKDDKCLSIFDQNQDVLTLTCYNHTDISTAAAKLQSFVAAYIKANPNTDSSSIFYGPVTIKSKNKSGVITSSYSSGYDIAEMVVQNGATKQLALFYNKDGGAWHYITQAEDEYGFKCSTYTATPDARKAMYNQICLGGQGQVRLDTDNKALQ